MTRFAAALAGALVIAGSAQASSTRTDQSADSAAVQEAHVLLLDRSAIKASGSDEVPIDIRSAAGDIVKRMMATHDANVVLDKSATTASDPRADITAQVLAELKTVHPEWIPARTVTTTSNVTAASRFLVIDLDYLRLPAGGSVSILDPLTTQRLQSFADLHVASLVVNREAVVVGRPAFDATKEAALYLDAFRKTAAKPRLPPIPFGSVAHMTVLDRQALLRNSMVGVSIEEQIKSMTKDAEAELRPESESLKQERTALEGLLPSLSDTEKRDRTADLEQREAAFRQKVQRRQDQIKAAVVVAQKQVEDVAGPIVLAIMKSEGADLLVDKQAVVMGGRDLTPLAIKKLNAVMPRIALVLDPAEKK
jgi:Skp family chaperone for outer membrane proteins